MQDRQPLSEWFGKSRAVDAEGKPLVVYRGEHGEPVERETFQSRRNSLSFGDREVANTYAMDPNDCWDIAQAPRVIPAHLKIEKPIIENRNDPFLDLAHLQKKLGTEEARRIALKFDKDIQYTGSWEENYANKYDSVANLLKEKPEELKNLYFDTFRYLDDPAEVERLKKEGFDGAIHVGNGETAGSIEYRVFDHKQVRPALWGSHYDGTPSEP